MCEYCITKASNKIIKDIDNDNEDKLEVVRHGISNLLKVELNVTDEDGYKASDYFPILYCPMCGRKLGDKNE